MENNFENLTLVITTYNRFAYLERALRYYLSFFPAENIVVLDSSFEEPPQGVLKEMLGKIVYKKFPKDLFLGSKIAQGLKEIGTEYCVLSADDDFLFPDALKQAVDFISTHDDYSCVHGDSLQHSLEKVHDLWEFRVWPLRFGISSIEDASCEERLKKFFPSRYEGQVFYAVYRAKTLQQIWSMTAKGKLYWGLFEIVSVCQAYIYGKVKVLPVLYISREINLYEGTVSKSRFLKVGLRGQEILSQFIKKGILEEAFSTELRLKRNIELKEEMIKEIAKDDFDEIWFILQESFKTWVSGGKEKEWYTQERVSSAMTVLMEALTENENRSLSRKVVEGMFRRFRQLESHAARPKTRLDEVIFKFGNHFRFKKMRRLLAMEQGLQKVREAVLSAQIDPRLLDVPRLTYMSNRI